MSMLPRYLDNRPWTTLALGAIKTVALLVLLHRLGGSDFMLGLAAGASLGADVVAAVLIATGRLPIRKTAPALSDHASHHKPS